MPFNIAIIDYEMGNLKSIYNCLKHINVDAVITDSPKKILNADGVILPGVGAFRDAIRHLKEKNLISVLNQVVNEETPLFGICLGQQLIFSKSYEMGDHNGLSFIEGKVIPFDLSKVNKVPHIGWNSVEFLNNDHFLIQGIPNKSYFYFVHSFYSIPENKEYVLGLTQYGDIEFCSLASKGNIITTQFHPEKSSKYGIKMYENFVYFCRR